MMIKQELILAFNHLEVTPLKCKVQDLPLEIFSFNVVSDDYIWKISPG